jgi:hypothetical protein
MPYVNIPVPEEHVEEVMQFVLRAIARSSIEPWDEGSITEFFGSVDEPSRALLAVVARASMQGRDLPEAELATAVQLNWREVYGITRDLNERASRENRPALVAVRLVTETNPNGRTTERRVYSIADEVAPLVEAADRADLLADGHPLGQSPADQ